MEREYSGWIRDLLILMSFSNVFHTEFGWSSNTSELYSEGTRFE
jgi:hypothetical protein